MFNIKMAKVRRMKADKAVMLIVPSLVNGPDFNNDNLVEMLLIKQLRA